ncbi:MAG: DegV family protein [Dehalobacterium sp.]
MCSVKIVTDSTSYITPAVLAKYQISEVSLIVNFDKRSFPENKEKNYHSFFEELKMSKIYPTTSQPAVGDFVETYRHLTDDGSSVISLHISGLLSGTVQAAKTAAGMLEDRDICVVDSMFTVTALGFIVEEAGKMASAGKNKEEILSKIEEMKNHTYLFFLVDTLEYLYRGGRIGGASALFGNLLQIKPILHVKDGLIDVLTKVRTREKAIRQLLLEVEKRIEGDGNKKRIGVLHVDNPEGAEHLKDLLQKKYSEVNSDFYAVGPVIGSHVGPGTTGIVITQS